MSLRSVSLALSRLALGLILFGAAAPLAVGEAQAFGDKDKKVEAPVKGGKVEPFSPEQIKARNEARQRLEEEEAANPTPPRPVRRASMAKVAKQKPPVPADVEVAGCATGMACIVCVAGCTDRPLSIVSSVPGRKPQ